MSREEETPRVARSSMDDILDLYKRDVDRALLIENLEKTPDERVQTMVAMLEFLEGWRVAGSRAFR